MRTAKTNRWYRLGPGEYVMSIWVGDELVTYRAARSSGTGPTPNRLLDVEERYPDKSEMLRTDGSQSVPSSRR